MKKCFKCGVEKELTEFHKHPGMADGRLGKCKVCARIDVTENRNKKIEYYREFDRKRTDQPSRVQARKQVYEKIKSDPEFKRARAEKNKEWQQKNLIKRAAHIIVGNAIRSGRLIVKPCERCGNTETHAHHEDYEKPLEVNWLCKVCHGQRHREINAEKRK